MMRIPGFLLFISLIITPSYAVVNDKAQRREAPLDSYGPPHHENLGLPIPVYGVPDGPVAKYPAPPPDIPPPLPQREYGVPILKYGPPKVHVEYGPPPLQQIHHHKPSFHGSKPELSFFDQIKAHFGIAKPIYGPPPLQQGKPHFPKPIYGVPSFGQQSFGGSFNKGPSFHQGGGSSFLNPPAFLSIQSFGPKPLGPPASAYGPPIGKPFFGGHHHSSIGAPPTPPEIRCDGWKPIPGPAIQPESLYGPPANGINLHSAVGFETVSHHGHDEGLQLPHTDPAPQFHTELNLGSSGLGDVNIIQGNGFDLSHNIISDSYGPPQPITSYGPPPLPRPKPIYRAPPVGLLPPSGVYGVPPGGTYAGLAIQHGSVSGNLKPWPVQGSAPIRPIAFRPPVPQGLIESIGHSVQHQDTFGVQLQTQPNIYLPPPTGELPNPPHGLNSLPLENSARPFLSQHNILPSPLPLAQEPRGAGHDCGHGPIQIQDSYGPPPSGIVTQQISSTSAVGDIGGGGIISSYEPPPSGLSLHQPHAVYGVPNFSSSGSDSLAYDSQGRASTLQLNVANADEEKTKAEVSGLTGLNVISAQKSQSITIPVQGSLGTYQLQFQSADPLGGNSLDNPPHEQLLSEGLLRSILSAIEPPNQNIVQQVTHDQHNDHHDVAVFLKSPEGQEALAEPNHSRE